MGHPHATEGVSVTAQCRPTSGSPFPPPTGVSQSRIPGTPARVWLLLGDPLAPDAPGGWAGAWCWWEPLALTSATCLSEQCPLPRWATHSLMVPGGAAAVLLQGCPTPQCLEWVLPRGVPGPPAHPGPV